MPYGLLLLRVAVAVSATGLGRFSIDHALRWDDNVSGLCGASASSALGTSSVSSR